MLGQRTQRTFLGISFGKIRKAAKQGDAGVIERELQDSTKSYAIEYDFVQGQLVNITFETHPKYGNSFVLHIDDIGEVFAVKTKENSAFGDDLLKLIPNLKQNKFYRFAPYDFMGKDGKEKRGLSIFSVSDSSAETPGERVLNFYQDFAKNEDGSWTITNKNNFPDYTGKKGDKDDWKIYSIQATKFLRERAIEYLKTSFKQQNEVEPEATASGSDLPF